MEPPSGGTERGEKKKERVGGAELGLCAEGAKVQILPGGLHPPMAVGHKFIELFELGRFFCAKIILIARR